MPDDGKSNQMMTNHMSALQKARQRLAVVSKYQPLNPASDDETASGVNSPRLESDNHGNTELPTQSTDDDDVSLNYVGNTEIPTQSTDDDDASLTYVDEDHEEQRTNTFQLSPNVGKDGRDSDLRKLSYFFSTDLLLKQGTEMCQSLANIENNSHSSHGPPKGVRSWESDVTLVEDMIYPSHSSEDVVEAGVSSKETLVEGADADEVKNFIMTTVSTESWTSANEIDVQSSHHQTKMRNTFAKKFRLKDGTYHGQGRLHDIDNTGGDAKDDIATSSELTEKIHEDDSRFSEKSWLLALQRTLTEKEEENYKLRKKCNLLTQRIQTRGELRQLDPIGVDSSSSYSDSYGDSEYSDEFREIEHKLAEATRNLSNADLLNLALQEKLDEKEQEIKQLKEHWDSITAQLFDKDVEGSVSTSSSSKVVMHKVKLLMEKLQDTEKIFSQTKDQLSDAESSQMKLENKLNEKERDTSYLLKRCEHLSTQLKEKEEKLKEKEEKWQLRSKASKESLEINQENSDLKKRCDMYVSQINKYKEMEQNNSQLTEDLQEISQKFLESQELLLNEQTSREKLEETLKKKEQEIVDLRNRCKRLSTQSKSEEVGMDDGASVRSLNSNSINSDLTDALARLKSIVKEKEIEISQLKKKVKELEASETEASERLKEMEEIEMDLIEVSDAFVKVEAERQEMIDDHEREIQEIIDDHEKEIQEIKDKNEEEKRVVEGNHNKDVQETRENHERAVRNFLDEMMSMVADIEQEKEFFLQNMDAKKMEIAALKAAVKAKDQEITSMKNKYVNIDLDDDTNKLRKEIADVKKEKESLLKDIQAEKDKVCSLEKTLAANCSRIPSSMQNVFDELRSHYSANFKLKKDISELQKEKESLLEDIQSENRKVSDLEKAAEKKEEELTSMRAALDELRLRVKSFTKEKKKQKNSHNEISSNDQESQSYVQKIEEIKQRCYSDWSDEISEVTCDSSMKVFKHREKRKNSVTNNSGEIEQNNVEKKLQPEMIKEEEPGHRDKQLNEEAYGERVTVSQEQNSPQILQTTSLKSAQKENAFVTKDRYSSNDTKQSSSIKNAINNVKSSSSRHSRTSGHRDSKKRSVVTNLKEEALRCCRLPKSKEKLANLENARKNISETNNDSEAIPQTSFDSEPTPKPKNKQLDSEDMTNAFSRTTKPPVDDFDKVPETQSGDIAQFDLYLQKYEENLTTHHRKKSHRRSKSKTSEQKKKFDPKREQTSSTKRLKDKHPPIPKHTNHNTNGYTYDHTHEKGTKQDESLHRLDNDRRKKNHENRRLDHIGSISKTHDKGTNQDESLQRPDEGRRKSIHQNRSLDHVGLLSKTANKKKAGHKKTRSETDIKQSRTLDQMAVESLWNMLRI